MRLVLLPGLDGTGRLFAPFIKVLPSHYSPVVVAYPVERTLSYAALTNYVQQFMPQEEDHVLVAESFSGPIAIRLASGHPPNLKALVLCATFVSNPAPLSLDLSFLLREWLFAISPPDFVIRTFLVGRKASANLVLTFRATVQSVPASVLAFRTRTLFTVDVREAFTECQVPILYLVAKEDKLLRRSSVEEMKEIKPEMEVVEIDGPHLLLQQNPRECLETIDRFVKQATRSN